MTAGAETGGDGWAPPVWAQSGEYSTIFIRKAPGGGRLRVQKTWSTTKTSPDKPVARWAYALFADEKADTVPFLIGYAATKPAAMMAAITEWDKHLKRQIGRRGGKGR